LSRTTIILLTRSRTASWDDWVPQDRLRKYTEENKELAQNLKKDMDALRQRSAPKATTASKKKHVGSDLSSTRGSEERNSSVPVTGRGQKRGREFEIEKVGTTLRSSATPPGPGTPDGASSQGSLFAPISPRPPPSPAAGSAGSISSSSSSDLSTPPASPAASPGGAAVTTKAAKKPTSTPTATKPKGGPKSRTTRSQSKVSSATQGELDGAIMATGPKLAAAKITEQPKKRKLEPAMLDKPEPSAKRVRGAQGTKNVPVPAKGASQKPKTQSDQAETSKRNNGKKQSTKVCTPKQEETFVTKPAVKIPIPDNLKMILVDDWEQVTKNHAILPLPVPHPVNEILELYEEDERKNRRPGSAEYDLLVETVHGIKEYFAKCLGKILLYKLEREQYFEMRACWEGCILEWEGKGPGDIYGAEHLIRLFCKSIFSIPQPFQSSHSHPFISLLLLRPPSLDSAQLS